MRRFGRRSTGRAAPSGSGRISISTERDLLVAVVGDPESFLAHDDPGVRRLAVSVCAAKFGRFGAELAAVARNDPDPSVRALAVEALGDAEALAAVRSDQDARVREAVATAYGEQRDAEAIEWLIDRAVDDEDRLVRESAVAALGAIGDERALPTLLELVAEGPPRVRRRAVVALTAFDDPAVEPAIRQAARDRNPGVREAAEMVVGRNVSGD